MLLLQEFTCPLCAGGFIEELPPATEQTTNNSNDDVEMAGSNDNRYDISTLIMNSLTGIRPMDYDSDQSTQDGSNTASGSSTSGNSMGNRFDARRNRRRLTQEMPNFDNIMHEFLISITDGLAGNGLGAGMSGIGGPMFFMGNPGDYAWGREGWDSVITQMLNQMENSGPPPLSKEKIKDIPQIEIDDEQLDRKLQCSVCWDDFERHEQVRKLPCTVSINYDNNG